MIVNGNRLIAASPIKDMETQKHRSHGVSWGLAEAGYDIRLAQDVWLHPFRRFVLASSMEEFDIPTDMIGICHDKSTNIRRGISVFNTVLECGWRGFLTIEIGYHCWRPIKLPAGMGIAQIIFHRLECPASYTGGKYDNQPARPVAAILR